jgi:hypothetical protein
MTCDGVDDDDDDDDDDGGGGMVEAMANFTSGRIGDEIIQFPQKKQPKQQIIRQTI